MSRCPYCGERKIAGMHWSFVATGAFAGAVTWLVLVVAGRLGA